MFIQPMMQNQVNSFQRPPVVAPSKQFLTPNQLPNPLQPTRSSATLPVKQTQKVNLADFDPFA